MSSAGGCEAAPALTAVPRPPSAAPTATVEPTRAVRVGMLSAEVSRKAGGLFFAMTGLAKAMHRPPELDINVFGLSDDATKDDSAAWRPVPVVTAPVLGPRSFGFSAALGPRVRQAGPDILHVHGLWMYPSVVSRRWSSRVGAPYVVSPHGMLDGWALRNSRWKKRLASSAYERRHLERAACLHALCESEVEAIRAYGLTNPVSVIPNGIEVATARPPKPWPSWRSALGENAKVLLYLGRLHPKKGLKNLLLACSRLRRAADGVAAGWVVAIAGWDQDGHRADLENLVRELDLEDSVRFLGPRFEADKEAAFLAADGFILPSLSEGLPMSVLEAWAHALPVVMTERCNLDEGFRAGAALRVEPDPDSLTRTLRCFFAMGDERRRQIGEAGRDLVSTRFQWASLGSQMESVYRWLLGLGERPACVRETGGNSSREFIAARERALTPPLTPKP